MRSSDRTRYILITQCLQNDMFLERTCNLYLGDAVSLGMLLGRDSLVGHIEQADGKRGGRLKPNGDIQDGPLGRFLKATIGERLRQRQDDETTDFLDVINVTDWHGPGESYDFERDRYGRHCEENSWGASYIDGLREYLEPDGGKSAASPGGAYCRGKLRLWHVRSDSVFDFRPSGEQRSPVPTKYKDSRLTELLNVLVDGSDEAVAQMALAAPTGQTNDSSPNTHNVYVAVIGVHTDIKVHTLLAGIRARYNVTGLAVSDTLTAAPSLERHLTGLDFADKVLDVEVIHGVNDLVCYLGGESNQDADGCVGNTPFAQFRNFFLDKQRVLSHQDEMLREYATLTRRRSVDLYRWVKWANISLIISGLAFLLAALGIPIAHAIWPARVDTKLAVLSGGIGTAQFFAAFFFKPMNHLQDNLSNLAAFQMDIERHSLKSALVRFHLTAPTTLRDMSSVPTRDGTEGDAERQIRLLRSELEVVNQAFGDDYTVLKRLGYEDSDKDPSEYPAVPGESETAGASRPSSNGSGDKTTHQT